MEEHRGRFGDQLRRYREAAGYSQEDLAERAGMSVNAIGAIERGERKRPYPDTIRRLADALNLDEATRLTLAATLRVQPGTAPIPPAIAREETPAPAELPGELTPFIGRDRELGVVGHLLAQGDGRLLTLVGPGGVGKTRLALHLARSVERDYAGGVIWVELAPLSDPELVLPTIGRTLGIEEPARGDPAAALRAWLRDRHILLVLDNVEHLPAAIPEIAHLLATCPRLHILATSRSPLRIRGEQEYPVPPLELPSANASQRASDLATVSSVQFFVWQAQQKSPSFSLTDDNAATVAAICRRLDGLPLALELVAARVRVISLDELLARLDRLLPLLVGGARDLPKRQQTMRAAIAWSYELLDPEAQALFRRLAVFAGGWSLEAAETVGVDGGETPGEVLDRLDALVEQSLVRMAHEGNTSRYGMLEPIRQFALEQLEASGVAGATWRCHARFFQALAEQSRLGLEGRSGQTAWLERLDREHDNLRAALAWSERAPDGAEIELRLASSLWRYWEVRWYVDEGSRWLAGALARSDGLPPELRALALSAAGNLARDRADHDQATSYHERSLALRRQLGDTRGIAVSLNNLGVIARDRGDAEQTMRLCGESLALYREVDDQHGAAIALISLGTAAGMLGEVEQARWQYGESLALFRAEGDDWHTAWVLAYLAELLASHDDPVTAGPIAEEALALHRASGDAWGIATALGILGHVALAEQDIQAATARFAEALRLLVRARVDRAIPSCLDDLAGALLADGQPDHAARLAGGAESLRATGHASDIPGHATIRAPELAALRAGPHAEAWQAGRALTRDQVYADAWGLIETIAPSTG